MAGYAEAWDDDFGLVTGQAPFISLLVRSEADVESFSKDIGSDVSFGSRLTGYNDEGQQESKRATILGSIPVDRWQSTMFEGIIRHEIPLLFLPHCGGPYRPQDEEDELLRIFAYKLVGPRRLDEGRSLIESYRARMDGIAASYEALLRVRLADFPASYAFMVSKVIRDLQHVVRVILQTAFLLQTLAAIPAVVELFHRLYYATLRGITYGVEALTYHGFGLFLGKDRHDASVMLDFIRNRRHQVTRRDIQVKYPRLHAERRDRILDRLAEAGVVRLDGRVVIPVSFSRFLKAIPTLRGFPSAEIPFGPRRGAKA
jgi:hypothetical protein